MPEAYRVGIVGFGMAGGALVSLLTQAGHSVTLLERSPRVGPVGAGLLLQPSGQGALQRLGLFRDIAACSEPLEGLHARMQNGRTLSHLRYEQLAPGCSGYGVHRGLLFETLHRAVTAKGVPVCLDANIVQWRESADAIYALDTTGQEYGPFDFLVAADGLHSALRNKVDPRSHTHEYDYGAMWAVGPCTAVRRYLHQVVSGTQYLAGVLPVGGERATLFWGVRRDRMEAVRQAGFSTWREEVVQLCPASEEIFSEVTDFAQVTFTGYCHVTMRRCYTDRVLCLGDAAHAMSPHLGQGVSLALHDVEVFAQALAETSDFRTAFRLFAQRRKQQVAFYSAVTALLTPFFQSDISLLGWGRDIALPLMTRIPPIRKQMLLTMAGIKTSVLSGMWNALHLLPTLPPVEIEPPTPNTPDKI